MQDLLGGLMSWGQSAYEQYQAGERQEDAQTFNMEEAQRGRDYATLMDNTKYQRQVKDLIAADLNPMLAYGHGPSAAPSPGIASSGIASSGGHSIAAGMQAGSASELMKAQTSKTEAETDVAKATADEIRARTPTHAVNIESTQQQIEESKNRVMRILQEVKTGGATEDNLRQQSINLQEIIPQIRATITQIAAQTGLTRASTGLAGAHTAQANAQTALTGAQTGEVNQRVQAVLPQLQRDLMTLEKAAKNMQLPKHQQDESVHEGFVGSLSAVIRALTGLGAHTNIGK